jgi:hypothetical protein
MNSAMLDLPDTLSSMMDDMMMAKLYNTVTGASVTHRDVTEWGFTEKTLVRLAIELM